ncbi:MAG TPA: N-acetyltransferase [Myxococcota bacterium]|nr:N-acetyltransferase [Myxococcota bacterium]
MTAIRPGQASDREAIRAVHTAAFGRSDEAEIVLRLLAREPACVSLVAERDDELVGHVLFSPVRVEDHALAPPPYGLAPLAVLPAHQRDGAGSALARAGIEACRKLGAPFLVVLGHPPYYPRFGFVPAMRFGLTFGDAPPRDAFMALELVPGALARVRGRVRYAPEFG